MDLEVTLHQRLSYVRLCFTCRFQTAHRVGDAVLQAGRDRGEMPFVAGNQDWVGFTADIIGQIERTVHRASVQGTRGLAARPRVRYKLKVEEVASAHPVRRIAVFVDANKGAGGQRVVPDHRDSFVRNSVGSPHRFADQLR